MIIIHGDNQLASRQFFITQKEQARQAGKQVVDLPGDRLDLEQLVTASGSVSLLGSANAVFVEGFFSRRPSNEKKAVTEYLTAHPKLEAVLWDGKDVSTPTKDFPAPVIKKFDLPKHIWQFLDTFSLSSLRQSLAHTEPEQLLALLGSRLRQLIMVKDGTPPAGLAAWQVGKLRAQSAKHSLSDLIAMHAALLEIDYRQKTSASAADLSSALELWLVKHVK